jgi:hypothetical protein
MWIRPNIKLAACLNAQITTKLLSIPQITIKFADHQATDEGQSSARSVEKALFGTV